MYRVRVRAAGAIWVQLAAAAHSRAENDGHCERGKYFHAATLPESVAFLKPQLRPLIPEPLLAFFQRDDLLADRFTHILTERSVKTIVFQLLQHVRAPARAARDRKHRSKQICWDSERVINCSRASATDSRRPASAASRMDRAKRRVSNLRFVRGAPEPAARSLCALRPSRSRLTWLPVSVFDVPLRRNGGISRFMAFSSHFCASSSRLENKAMRPKWSVAEQSFGFVATICE